MNSSDNLSTRRSQLLRRKLNSKDSTFRGNCFLVIFRYKIRSGVNVGDIDTIVYARPIVGRHYAFGSKGKMTLEKQWNESIHSYAHQMIVHDIPVFNQNSVQFTSISDIFLPDSVVFMLGHPHYGSMGNVSCRLRQVSETIFMTVAIFYCRFPKALIWRVVESKY